MNWLLASALPGILLASAATAQTETAFATSYKLEAEKRYEAAAQTIQPLAETGHEFATLRLGWLAYLQGSYNASIAHYGRLLQTSPGSIEARVGLMLPLMAQERWQDAAMQAQIALRQAPFHHVASVRLMACQQALKQWEALEAHAGALTRVYPSDADRLVFLARARAALANVAGAKAAYGQLLERQPAHAEALAYLRHTP
jgi:tetratricopeptide (TPR) repeat protein